MSKICCQTGQFGGMEYLVLEASEPDFKPDSRELKSRLGKSEVKTQKTAGNPTLVKY